MTALALCPEGAHVHIEVTLTQGAASGRGGRVGHCTGALEQYSVQVHTRGREEFLAGPATAEATALVRDRGHVLDEQEWTRAVTLQP